MRDFGKAWVVLVAVLVFLLLLGLGIFSWYIGGYNKAVNLEQGAEKAWADIDAALQRRLDLVPNLIETARDMRHTKKSYLKTLPNRGRNIFRPATGRARSRRPMS